MYAVNLNELKNFMIRENLTEPALAKKIGVSYSYVYRVLRGQRSAGKTFILGMVSAGIPSEKIFVKSLPKCNKGRGEKIEKSSSSSG